MSDSPLHKVPLGLLELMRLKTLGRAPEFFDDVVIPTLDALEAYAAPEIVSAGTAPAVGAINVAAGLVNATAVSAFRWVWSLGGALTLGAAPGTYITWWVAVAPSPGAEVAVLGSGELRTTVAGQVVRFGVALPRPLVLRAGGLWFATVYGDAVGVDHSLISNLLSVPGALLV